MATARCIIFDADGVLFDEENPYLAIASKLGVDVEVRKWVHEYLDEKMKYQELVDKEIELFKSAYQKTYGKRPETGDLERLLPFPEFRKGVEPLFKKLLDNKKDLYILSSGFMHLTRELTRLKVKQENIYSNRFLYDTNGEFVTMHIDVHADKIEAFDTIVKRSDCEGKDFAYIGDNAFDEAVMKHALSLGAQVYLLEEAVKKFEMKKLPESENFRKISHLSELNKVLL